MGNIIRTKLWLWVIFFLVINEANGCWEEERNALLELEASMASSSGGYVARWLAYNETGFLDCCSWYLVECNLATGRVTKLNLKAVRLGSGHGWRFNASLFLPFKSLQVLKLSENYITGWTKNEGFDKLLHLTSLKVLDLLYNPINPNVLPSLCWISSLEVLRLGDLRGGDTMGLIQVPSLENYTMHIDRGSEKCPGLRNLRVLWLAGYGIKDIRILYALGLGTHSGLKNLERLYLNENSFNSSIFSSLKDLPSLKHLELSNNEIDGKIEMSDIIALSNLEFLGLGMNNFASFETTKGSKRKSSVRSLRLGNSLSNSTNIIQSLILLFPSLHSLYYGDSDLTDPAIAYALRNLSRLEYLYLAGSSLNQNFLSSIGTMNSLKVLEMGFGDNYGTLPNQGWCELKNIQELDFGGNSFEGTLPICLGNLTSLRWLSLQGNLITGNIVSYPIWTTLTSLEYLDISFNQFEVPLSFKQFANNSKLTNLDVGYNTITTDTESRSWTPTFQLKIFSTTGCKHLQKLPSFLHYQYDLRILSIQENELPGNFPTWLLENNTRLAGLYARENAFLGLLKFPSSCQPRLMAIDVSGNKLNGNIPANISSIFPKLRSLNMSKNFLEGPIPSDIGGFHLKLLDLSHNFLSGGFPSDLAIASPFLYYLRLSNNQLKGQLFSIDIKPRVLFFLYLNSNNFEGPLPTNIFLNSLIALDASNNNFTGEIPGLIRDNTRLLQLDLSKNHLEGSIPVEICNLKLIQVLAISENRLSGSIPSCVSGLPLEHIHLDKNQLGGELEDALFNISSLITLDLSYNSFTGNIPHIIGSLSNMNFLLLNNNQLEGEIPSQICLLHKLSIMDLSFNKLFGPLLPCLDNLTQVENGAEIKSVYFVTTSRETWLDFLNWITSTRHYHIQYGFIRDFYMMDVETHVVFSTKRNSYTYKGSILRYMSGIDLSSNRLTGEIPIELGNLSKIHALNLSHNHLTGSIPNTFSSLHEIESLDLSYNSLNGRIPVSLLELHSLAIFSLAYNNLSGAVPEFKSQFATFDKSSYEGNPFLCGYPLDNECSITNSSTTSSDESEESTGFMDMESFFIGFVVSYGTILLGLAAALCFNPYWRRAWFRFVEVLILNSYYFYLDKILKPIKNRWWRVLASLDR